MLAIALTAVLVGSPVDLAWRAPAGCPDLATAHATIEKLLEGQAPEGRRVVAGVVIEPGGKGFRARVRIDDGTSVGERELEAASCEEVGDAAALIVAMAVDPRLAGDLPPDEPQPDEPPIPTPPPGDVTTTPDAGIVATPILTPVPVEPTPRRKRPPLKFLLRAGGGVGYGSVPTVAGVVMIAFALAGPRWRVELDADVWTPRTRTSPQNEAIGVRVLGWTLGVRGCGSPLAMKLEIPLCAGVRAGALHGEGTGPIESSSKFSPWITATGGIGLWGWIVPRFALALDIDGFVSLTRPAFDTQPSNFIVLAPAGGVRAVFGPVVKLP